MKSSKTITTIDEYIAQFPEQTKSRLELIRQLVKKLAPQATETIGYGIPTFKLNGNLVHFGAYEHHIGFYPTPKVIEAFLVELKGYKMAKGSVQFPLDQELPIGLIEKMVEFRLKQI